MCYCFFTKFIPSSIILYVSKKSLFDIEKIYEAFFDKADDLLDKKAVIIMYSRNPEFVKEYSHLSNCNIKEDFEISKKDNSHLFVLAR